MPVNVQNKQFLSERVDTYLSKLFHVLEVEGNVEEWQERVDKLELNATLFRNSTTDTEAVTKQK